MSPAHPHFRHRVGTIASSPIELAMGIKPSLAKIDAEHDLHKVKAQRPAHTNNDRRDDTVGRKTRPLTRVADDARNDDGADHSGKHQTNPPVARRVLGLRR